LEVKKSSKFKKIIVESDSSNDSVENVAAEVQSKAMDHARSKRISVDSNTDCVQISELAKVQVKSGEITKTTEVNVPAMDHARSTRMSVDSNSSNDCVQTSEFNMHAVHMKLEEGSVDDDNLSTASTLSVSSPQPSSEQPSKFEYMDVITNPPIVQMTMVNT
jgi:hypothetical protein